MKLCFLYEHGFKCKFSDLARFCCNVKSILLFRLLEDWTREKKYHFKFENDVIYIQTNR